MARQFSPFRPPSPRRLAAGVRDLGTFLRTRGRADYVIAGIAAAMTLFIIFAFWHDSRFEKEQQIVYVQSWRADRPDSAIIAEQKRDHAERAEAEAQRRAVFQKMQKDTAGWL